MKGVQCYELFGEITLRNHPFFLFLAVKSHSCPSWCFRRLRLVGQRGFMDSGNADIVAVEESQQFSDYSVRVPLHQT